MLMLLLEVFQKEFHFLLHFDKHIIQFFEKLGWNIITFYKSILKDT